MKRKEAFRDLDIALEVRHVHVVGLVNFGLQRRQLRRPRVIHLPEVVEILDQNPPTVLCVLAKHGEFNHGEINHGEFNHGELDGSSY